MKRSLVIALLGVACSAVSSLGQGYIFLNNYLTAGPDVTYGTTGIPANGVSGPDGTVGAGLGAGWTFGFYYAMGNVTGSVASDPSGTQDPSLLGGGLVLATGANSTAAFFTSCGIPGEAYTGVGNYFLVAGSSPGDLITVMAVGYSGSSYSGATYRGHSTAFTMAVGNVSNPPSIGSFMSGFSVAQVPEPSVFALAGLGAFALLRFRRSR